MSRGWPLRERTDESINLKNEKICQKMSIRKVIRNAAAECAHGLSLCHYRFRDLDHKGTDG